MAKRILAQIRPSGTSATRIYKPDRPVVIDQIRICNVTALFVDVSVFVGLNSSTLDEDLALMFEEAVSANSRDLIPGPVCLESGDQLGVKTGTADAVTFTVFGYEQR